MLRFVIRRLLQSILVVVGVTFVTFGMVYLAGDPVMAMADQNWTDEQIEQVRRDLGFDRPWYVQYADYVWGMARGDFGVSIRQRQPALSLVKERIPATLELAGAALLISIVVSLPVGIISATRRNRFEDHFSMLFALLGQSIPVFWLGLMLILIFSVHLGWFPVAGRTGWSSIVLPAITLAALSTGRNARIVRSSMLEVLGQDFIRTARAKGLSDRIVLMRHALKNALMPVVTLIGLDIGALLSGAVITETIFAWPGIGRMTVQAVYAKDIPLVQASVTVLALTFVLINLIVDILYSYLDPRIRYS